MDTAGRSPKRATVAADHARGQVDGRSGIPPDQRLVGVLRPGQGLFREIRVAGRGVHGPEGLGHLATRRDLPQTGFSPAVNARGNLSGFLAVYTG